MVVLSSEVYGFFGTTKLRLNNAEMKSFLFRKPGEIYIEKPLFRDTFFDSCVAENYLPRPNVHRLSNEATVSEADEVASPAKNATSQSKRNEGAKIISIKERNENAKKRIEVAEQQRQEEQIERESHEKEAHEGKIHEDESSYCYRIIGEVVAKYFPAVRVFEPGTDEENLRNR